MIDLHTHTTASDGLHSPEDLVRRAKAAGVSVLAITDHDTVAGSEQAREACAVAGIELVPGIEITAIAEGGDVHVLGYFIDSCAEGLRSFLGEQRRQRLDRIRSIVSRLDEHGIRLDADALLGPALASDGKAVGRPAVARALVSAGVVADTNEAFEQWLARGRPAFVSRQGSSPQEVIRQIHGAGGIASLAHPGLLQRDAWIPEFAQAGLDAIEVFHTDHDEAATRHYLTMARQLGLAVSGGSDYHGDPAHGIADPGSVSLPAQEFAGLKLAAARRSAPRPPAQSSLR